jgi:5-methylcytosine-specific restriction protein B
MIENETNTKTITEEQIKDVYNKLLTYCNKELHVFQNEKQAQIVNSVKDKIINEKSYDWNETTLTDYINAIIYMIKGQEFARTINKFSENYFLNQLQEDFGDMIHTNAVESLRLHKVYYKKLSEERNLKKVVKIFCEKWDSTDGLWKNEYISGLSKSFRGYKINISYGVGVRLSNPNKSPYLNFLKDKFVTSKGIYPFITYHYQQRYFEVGLGISRDNEPDVETNIIDAIENYQSENIDIDNINKVVESINKAIDTFEIILNSIENNNIDNKQVGKMKRLTQPLNQILYGPPGTGKTYNTINKSIEIIENRLVDETENRIELKSKFDEYKKNGQIKFLTFHQSYGYEEFVEGIKAISPDDERNPTNELIYKVEDGIFKNLSNNAKPIKAQSNKLNFNWSHGNIFKMSLGGKNDSEILDWCLENDYISMGWGNEIDFTKVSSQNWESFRDESKSLFIDKEPDRFTIQAMYAFKEWMKKDDLVFVSLGNLKIVAIGQVVGDYEYKDSIDEIRYSQFRKVKWLFVDKLGIPVEKLLTKKLSQQTIYNLDKSYVNKDFLDSLFGENEQVEDKKYVLIIDEINRGNISKIFGELITLIEDSKRAGNDESVEVILPYSGEKFSVPRNLYILGTMNTADRSIALMDTALRRRFEFTEMMPNLEVLEEIDDINDINIKLLLETINKRIEYLYDRDHTIGHAYFMNLKEEDNNNIKTLSTIFQNKIIPLLQEYFYDDWEKIRLVLGDNQKDDENLQFIKIKEGYNIKNLFGDKGLDSLDIDDESNIYEINKAAFDNTESYIKVYEK